MHLKPDPSLVERHQDLADSKLPRHIRVLTHYMHSLTEIWEFYRARGTDLPKAFQAELARAEAELMAALEEETHQGGALHDYYKPKGTDDASRKSRPNGVSGKKD